MIVVEGREGEREGGREGGRERGREGGREVGREVAKSQRGGRHTGFRKCTSNGTYQFSGLVLVLIAYNLQKTRRLRNSLTQHNTTQLHSTQHNTTQHNLVQHNPTQLDTKAQHNTA